MSSQVNPVCLFPRLSSITSNIIQAEAAAISIARKLKGIPLAIEQAGAFLSFGVVSIHDYNRLFQAKYQDHTLKVPPREYHCCYEKNRPICVALNMVLEALQRRSPDSVKLLNLSVLLGPGEISFTMLSNAPLPGDKSDFGPGQASSSRGVMCLPDIPAWLIRLRNEEGSFGTAIQKLEQACLMKFNRDPDCQIRSYVIHEMVRSWIIGKLLDEEISEYAITAFALTGTILYNQSRLCSPQAMQKHTTHLNAILRIVLSNVSEETIKIPEGKYASLYGSVASGFGKFCRLQGQLDKAKELLTAAIEYRIFSEGQTWPAKQEHLIELEEVAIVEWRLGNFEKAIERYSSLLNQCKRILGDADDMTLKAATSLRGVRERQATIYHAAERAYYASRNVKRDYSIASEPPLYQHMDDEEWELKEGYEEAKNLLGENDFETIQRAEKLAVYYRKGGRLHEEEPIRETIWQYYSTIFEPTDRRSIKSLHKLCECYKGTGKLASELRGKLKLAPAWAKESHLTRFQSLLLGAEASEIFSAALEGRVDVVNELLDKQMVDVNKKDSYGNTALHWAVEGGHKPMIQLLLEKGADVHLQDEQGRTALHWAALKGDKIMLQLLLERGSDVAVKNYDGQIAMHLAALCGHREIVQLLLEKGSDVAAKNYGEETALHLAAWYRHKEVVQLLLENGSDVAAKNCDGETALHLAARYGHKEVVQLLLEKGSDVAAKDYNGRTAMTLAAQHGHKEVVQLLLEKRSNVAAKNYGEETALHQAAQHGHKEVVQLLLEKGSGVAAKNRNEKTALHLAAEHGDKEVVQLLLEKGSDVAVKNYGEETALHLAARYGHKEVVQLLLEKGSDVAAKDCSGRIALHLAARYGHKEVMLLLLEKRSDVVATDSNRWTALHLAADYGREEVVQLLLDKGSDVAAKENDGRTALHLAAQYRGEEVVRLLLEKGSDVATKDNGGWTALHQAAVNGHKAVVQLLLKKGSDVAAKDNGGRIALHLAAQYGHEEVVQLLLDKGSDVAAKDDNGQTALLLAAQHRREEVVQLLLEKGSNNAASAPY
jgi:ankyrin repeat protein